MEKKIGNRTLTQRYDMHAIHAIQAIEDSFLAAVASIYGCDPNDLPVEIDSLAVYNLPDEEMRGEVQGILKDAPGDISAPLETYLSALIELKKSGAKPTGK